MVKCFSWALFFRSISSSWIYKHCCVCKLFCIIFLHYLTLYPTQLRDCELAPVVNRDLARRVRNVNGITQHKQVLRNDIKLAAKLIHALDEKVDLWTKFQEEGQSSKVDP